jgi:hypothetical protein
MPKPTMLKRVLRKEKEDRGPNAPVLLSALPPGLVHLLRRLGGTSRGYTLAGAGVVVGAVIVVSLLSWLAPDSDRPISSPLELVGRVAGGVLEQVDDQAEALLGTDGESMLQSVREGLAAASSATPWPSNPAEIAASPYSGKASPDDSASPATDDAATPTRGESSSAPDGAPSQPASSAPSAPSETPTSTDTPSSPVTSEPTPPASEEPPVAEEPSTPPPAEEPPVAEEPVPPPVEEPVPPPAEEPPPVAEEPPPVPSDPPPAEDPPQTIPD